MTNIENPKWKDFEVLCHTLVKDLCGTRANVRYNQYMTGNPSGARRQIDVTISYLDPFGDRSLMIIDAKDHKRPVDIETYGKFRTLMEDIDADRGAIISRSGFTKPVINSAKVHGIKVLTPYDSAVSIEARDLQFTALLKSTSPTVDASIRMSVDAGDTICGDERLSFFSKISSDQGETWFDLLERFGDRWNNKEIPQEPGKEIILRPEESLSIYITDINGISCWKPLDDLYIVYKVTNTYWSREENTVHWRGFIDESNGECIAAHIRYPTKSLEIDSTWSQVGDPARILAGRNVKELAGVEQYRERILTCITTGDDDVAEVLRRRHAL